MKHLLLTTIAAVVVVGCGESQPPEPPTAKAPAISIHEAAANGNIEAVKQHIAAGTDVNVKNKFGSAPLHYAAVEGHKEVVELLLANGADVNAKDVDGETPVDFAEEVKDWHAPEDKAAKKETAALLRKHGGKTRAELEDEGK